jgi:thioredoxin-related protein
MNTLAAAASPLIEIPEITWLHEWKEAAQLARKLRRPILVDVYQDNCGGCDRLVDETFADPRVASAIAQRFVPVKLHLMQDRELTREWQVFWTPTILFGDRSGRIRYTSPNFLPADEFLDLLDIGEAMVAMRWQEYDSAITLLTGLEMRSPGGPLTPEAIYWRGVAAYFRDGKSSKSAHTVWDNDLIPAFPDSIWAKRIP